MTADARSLDDRLAMATALAHLAAVAGSATPETAAALAVVLPRLAELEDAALPAVDLDALHDRQNDEWHYGTGGFPTGSAVVAYPEPDGDGDTVYFRRIGWDRDSLPELAALIMAVHAASDPAKRVCDCGAEGEQHEVFCALTGGAS